MSQLLLSQYAKERPGPQATSYQIRGVRRRSRGFDVARLHFRCAGTPESLPDELRRALPRQDFVGLFEVIERGGI